MFVFIFIVFCYINFCKQTVWTLIRRRVLRRLIWVFTEGYIVFVADPAGVGVSVGVGVGVGVGVSVTFSVYGF